MDTFTSLTIAIPTYKRCETVVSLVNSLLPQLHDGDELLVVDDASFDGTSEALGSIDKVRLITKTLNEGMVKNWNTCLTSASNDWICVIHDDDTIKPNALQSIRGACSIVGKPALIGHGTTDFDFDDSFCYRVLEAGTRAVLHSPPVPSGVTIHKDIIDSVGLFNERFCYSPDLEYFPRVCTRFPFLIIENPRILLFNFHGQNYEYKTWCKEDFLDQLEEIELLTIKYSNLPSGMVSDLFKYRMNRHINHMFRLAIRADNKILLRQIGKSVKGRSYLSKKNHIKAQISSTLNWLPSRG